MKFQALTFTSQTWLWSALGREPEDERDLPLAAFQIHKINTNLKTDNSDFIFPRDKATNSQATREISCNILDK